MTLPIITANPRYLEQLRVGGGFGSLPNGGVDIDKAGRIAASGDVTVAGEIDAQGGLNNTAGAALLVNAPLELRNAIRSGTGGCNKTWSHWLNPAHAIKPSSAFPAGPTVVWNGNFSASYTYLDFDRSTRQFCAYAVSLPPDYDGSALKLTIFWTATAGTAGQVVIWRVRLGASADNGDTAATITDVGGQLTDEFLSAKKLHVCTTVAGTPTTAAGGQLLFINIDRQADSASDTLNAEARLLGARLQYA